MRFRTLTCFVSSMAFLAVFDPAELRAKAYRRFGRPAPNPAAKSLTKAGALLAAGDLRGAETQSASFTINPVWALGQLSVRFRTKFYEDFLDADFATSTPLSPADTPRVTYVVGNSFPYTNSGYSNRSHLILESAKRAGIDATALTRLGYPMVIGQPSAPDESVVGGISYRRAIPWLFPFSAEKWVNLFADAIVEEARRNGSTILHTTTGFHNALAVSKAAKTLNVPWIYEVRGELEKTWLSTPAPQGVKRSATSEQFLRWRAQETQAAKSAAAVVVLSELSRQDFIDRGVAPEKIHVIRNTADPALLDQQKPPLDPNKKELVIGTVTSVVPYEGLDVLIRSLEYLPEHVTALIVGDGSQRAELEDLTASLGLEHRVQFAGQKPKDEIIDWYRKLDVFVLPRKDLDVTRAVTPLKAANAMLLGIPVVASDLPAIREITGDSAKYVAPATPAKLAKALSGVIEGSYDYSGSSTWAKQLTWDETSGQLRRLYSGIIHSS